MARNRQKAKERQARRKAQKGNGDQGKSAPERRHGGDPIADDVIDELERESITEAGADPTITPPLSGSERLRGIRQALFLALTALGLSLGSGLGHPLPGLLVWRVLSAPATVLAQLDPIRRVAP